MKLTEDRTDRRIIITVKPYGNRNTVITIFKSRNRRDDSWQSAEVNWPSIGAVSSQDATLFAEALGAAAEKAAMLDEEKK